MRVFFLRWMTLCQSAGLLAHSHARLGDIKVGRTGWLHISPFFMPAMCDCAYDCGVGLSSETTAAMVALVSQFTDFTGVKPVLKNPAAEVGIPGDSSLKYWKPFADERPVYMLRSRHEYNCEEKCQRCCSCGVWPWEAKQDLLLSTHRVWWVESFINAPWCLPKLFGPRIERISWRNIRQFKYLRVSGSAAFMQEGKCAQCCGFETQASVELGAQGSFPIYVNHSTSSGKRGILDNADFNQFRELMASVLIQCEQSRAPVAFA